MSSGRLFGAPVAGARAAGVWNASAIATSLPPPVGVDLHEPALRDYWRARAEQHVQDSYAGVAMTKFPEDLRVYEHLLWLDGPDTLIEIGTQSGGSALWFRDRLAVMCAYGRIAREPVVVSIDIDQRAARRALDGCGNSAGITLVEGDVADAAVAEHVGSLIGERCLVVEDSAHTYASTSAALRNYARFVPAAGFMVVEDGCIDDEQLRLEHWPRGVIPALEDWLARRGRRGVLRAPRPRAVRHHVPPVGLPAARRRRVSSG